MFSFLKKLFGPGTDFKALKENGAIFIDVRTPQEFDHGHIQGSKNIPLDKIQREVKAIKNMNKPIITVCKSGARSGMAKSILKSAGVEVYNGGPWNVLVSKIR
jgi:rhodanese-related sulfurtransferase